jgi:hypothetical protein
MSSATITMTLGGRVGGAAAAGTNVHVSRRNKAAGTRGRWIILSAL